MADNKATNTSADQQNQGTTWDSLVKQIESEKNKSLREKAKGMLKGLLDKKAEAMRTVENINEEIRDLQEKYESGKL